MIVVGSPEDSAWTSLVVGVLEVILHSSGKRSMEVFVKKE
jgi:hypothetical protein